jgi:gliding motility-associated-like protein
MLPFFSRILHSTFLCAIIICLALTLLPGQNANAQSYGDPLVKITFGNQGLQYAGPLHPDSGYTEYTYVNRSPEDNQYTIANSTTGMNPAWVITTDHTGDSNGMMMIVNASFQPGLFYTRVVTGLCGSTDFQFSAWIKNILRRRDGILPKITFTVEDQSGNLLGGGGTGDIIADNTWNQYKFSFKTPANVQTVVIKMTNDAPGGGGNDLAIDDIEFRPFGAPVNVAFDRANLLFCEGTQQTINMRATTPIQDNFAVKFQMLTSGGWIDLRPADRNPSIAIQTPVAPGTYNYRMVTADAGNIDSPPCVVSSNYLSLIVLPLPQAVIDMPDEICMEPAMFRERSIALQAGITSYQWDFGDGTGSNERNPTHTYTSAGPKVVTLSVTNVGGCRSVMARKTINVIAPVNTNFRYTSPTCESQDMTFTDISTSTEGIIISRVWDFGDATPTVSKTDATPFIHTFAAANTYTVKLTTTTDKGCINTREQQVRVSALPEVNFVLPEVCYADYFANFKDSSFVAGSNAGLTYLWDFGDSYASSADNRSTQQNPQHHYSRPELYTVKLTVRTADGCEFTREKQLQINGVPIPAFEILNKDGICANQSATIVNKARASIGDVTKIEWYFDADRNTNVPDVVDNEPRPDKVYTHKFPPVMYPQASATYKIRMVAYTGDAGACQAIAEETVTILASPILEFTPPEIICLNNGPVNLNDYFKETTGIPGNVEFSGPGVRGNVFDPALAGVGQFTVKCSFTGNAGSGCVDEVSKVILVKPIPTGVDAGATVYVLAGNKTSLSAVATGNNLKYLWTPATGLSDATILNPSVDLLENTTTYKLTVTLEDGSPGTVCSVEDEVTVVVLKVPQIPNTFTPNGDGINDVWEIKNLQAYDGASITIFNRNGQRVYAATGYSKPWDGRMNGSDLPVGVYYYIIDPKYGRKQVSGYVTIIR